MSISGQALTDFDITDPVVSNYLTEAQLNAYLGQGCVFLPPSGVAYNYGSFDYDDPRAFAYGGYMTGYYTASVSGSYAYAVDISEDLYDPGYGVVRLDEVGKDFYLPVRLIRRATGTEGNWIRISNTGGPGYCEVGSGYNTGNLSSNPPVVYDKNWNVLVVSWMSSSRFWIDSTSVPPYGFTVELNSSSNPTEYSSGGHSG